jgi:hypothetical protein
LPDSWAYRHKWESYQADVERSIWVDDFVLGEERIGCPATP